MVYVDPYLGKRAILSDIFLDGLKLPPTVDKAAKFTKGNFLGSQWFYFFSSSPTDLQAHIVKNEV